MFGSDGDELMHHGWMHRSFAELFRYCQRLCLQQTHVVPSEMGSGITIRAMDITKIVGI